MYRAESVPATGQVEPHGAEELPSLEGDTLEAKSNIPLRAANAFIPIITLILGLGVSLYVTGEGDTITDIVGSADPYKAMMSGRPCSVR